MSEFRSEDDQFPRLFTLIRVIGKGSFGTVVHAIDRQSGEECAVKAISKASVAASSLDDLRTEAAILSTLNHPNIVKFRELKETPKNVYLVMEMVYGGTLASFLQRRKLTEAEAAKAMTGVFSAVKYLHVKGVIHRDIKPENILVENPGDLSSIKIADFGLSQQFQLGEINTSNDFCGTILFMAPEQLERKYYSKAVDIWSCGILMYMLCTQGAHPLKEESDSNEDYFRKLKCPQWKLQGLSSLAQNLFLRLVRLEPVERYSASQALLHPWVSGDTRDIPLTAIEQFRLYNDELRWKKVRSTQLQYALCFLGRLVRVQKGSAAKRSSESPVASRRQANVQFSPSARSQSLRIRRTSVRYQATTAKPPRPANTVKAAKPPIAVRSKLLRPISSTRRPSNSPRAVEIWK